MKVMCIDDESHFVEDLKHFIDGLGFQATCFTDGFLAAQAMEQDPPDLIITDMKMPGVHGMMMLLTAQKFAPYAHVVVLSGNSKEQSEQDYHGKIEVPYFRKPVGDDFFNFIQKLQPRAIPAEEREAEASTFNIRALDHLATKYQEVDTKTYDLFVAQLGISTGVRMNEDAYYQMLDEFQAALKLLSGEDRQLQQQLLNGFRNQYGSWGDRLLVQHASFFTPFHFVSAEGAVVLTRGDWERLGFTLPSRPFQNGSYFLLHHYRLEMVGNVPQMYVNQERVDFDSGLRKDQLFYHTAASQLVPMMQMHRLMQKYIEMSQSAHVIHFWDLRQQDSKLSRALAFQYNTPVDVLWPDGRSAQITATFWSANVHYYGLVEEGEEHAFGPGFDYITGILSDIPTLTSVRYVEESEVSFTIHFDSEKNEFSLSEKGREIEVPLSPSMQHDFYEMSPTPVYKAHRQIRSIYAYIAHVGHQRNLLHSALSRPAQVDKSSSWIARIFGKK
ncbi:MAG: response regulator [Zetaproteobacteria bacterium]|nr:response regulator [Zetaproteobacteria bacterium]